MKITACILLALLMFWGCQGNEGQIRTLERAYSQSVKTAIENYEFLYKNIDDMGNRPKDVALLRNVDTLQALRKKAGITFGNLDCEHKIDVEAFNKYMALANKNAKILMVVRKQKEFTSTAANFLAKYQKNPSQLNLLNFLINLAMLENLIIDGYRITVGYNNAYFSIIFNMHSNGDTLKVDSIYKMMLSLRPDVTTKFWGITIDSLVLTRNGAALASPYKFEKIGGTAYFEYKPTQKGAYTIGGDYKMAHKREGFAIQERFLKHFIVQ